MERKLIMKEQLYTIPVNDAFAEECECPVCQMVDTLEKDAIDFVMGPSYMEDDIRMQTNKVGFCSHHVKLLYKNQNRLGLALMLHTHMQHTNRQIESLLGSVTPVKKGLFGKKQENTGLVDYLRSVEHSCYICDRIEQIYRRYLATIYHCYQKDPEFADKFRHSKGFCTKHFADLYEAAADNLSGKHLETFLSDLGNVYLDNMKRVTDDLEWFTDKFDHRNADAPWKNSKDALPRSINKVNSIPADQVK